MAAAAAAANITRVSFRGLLQKTGRRNHYGFSVSIPSKRNVSNTARATAAAAVGVPVPLNSTANYHHQQQRRHLSGGFSFAGPRVLQDVLKTELLDGKKATEIADLWYTYHETKVRVSHSLVLSMSLSLSLSLSFSQHNILMLQDNVVGLVFNGNDGKAILSRAATCPYFVQPVFRDDGFFMLLSEFQPPRHFLLAYLQDYKMDPHSATPLLTFSVFVDYADAPHDISLVRCDVLNANINVNEGRKVVQSLLDNYRTEADYGLVKLFNQRPNAFDIDDHISRMNVRWNSQDGNDDDSSSSSSSSSTTTTTP
jgi:ATP synthase mitochondrial F1 complex assembly factor 1